MAGGGEAAHVRADLGEQDLGRPPADARDGLQPLQLGRSKGRSRSPISALTRSRLASRKSMWASCWATRKR